MATKWHISQIFLWMMIWFISGIGLGMFFILPKDFFAFSFFILFLTISLIFYRNYFFKMAFLALIFFSFGFWRSNSFLNKFNQTSLNNSEIQGAAEVVENPVRKFYDSSVVVYFKNEKIKVLVKMPKYVEIFYGDELNLKCKLTLPEKFNDFDYRMYLATKNITYISNECEWQKIGERKSIFSILAKWRIKMENNINVLIPAPQSALANGIIFGGDDQLTDDLKNDFSKTGMTHIVAVSGYNVTIIAMVIMSVAIFLGFWRKQSVWLAIGFVFLFVAIIGFPPSGVRAMIMGSLVLIAVVYGRSGDVVNAICFSAVVMLFFNPLLLRYDVGFQLSFLATLGIVLIYPIFERYLVSKCSVFGITEIIFLTISAQLFVLPIILYNFHILSTVSLIANLLILPIIPLTMLFVFLTMMLSFVFFPLATLFSWLAYFFLFYEVAVVQFLAQQKWSSIHFEKISFVWFFLYYLVLIEILRVWYKKKKN